MKNYNLIGGLIIMLSLLPIAFQAQAPGYLGQKISFDLSLGLSPAIFSPTQNNNGGNVLGSNPDAGGFALNHAFEAGLNLVVKRYGSITLSGGQYYTGMITNITTPSLVDNSNQDFHTNLHRLNVKTIGIRYNRFKPSRGALAPIGRTFSFGLEKLFISGEIIDRIVNYAGAQGGTFGHGPVVMSQKYSPLALYLGWANTVIYFDKLLIKTGLGMHIPLDLNAAEYLQEEYSQHPDFFDSPNDARFKVDAYKRVFLHGLLRFEIGVGYLIY